MTFPRFRDQQKIVTKSLLFGFAEKISLIKHAFILIFTIGQMIFKSFFYFFFMLFMVVNNFSIVSFFPSTSMSVFLGLNSKFTLAAPIMFRFTFYHAIDFNVLPHVGTGGWQHNCTAACIPTGKCFCFLQFFFHLLRLLLHYTSITLPFQSIPFYYSL